MISAALLTLLCGCHGAIETGFEMDTSPLRAHSGSLAVRGGFGELREPDKPLLATDAALRLQSTAEQLDVSVGLGFAMGVRHSWDWDVAFLARPTLWVGTRGLSASLDLVTLVYLNDDSDLLLIAPRFEAGGDVGTMAGLVVGYGTAQSFSVPH